ncbi:MAG TPA: hypothetical protein VI461_04350 [Chitinophagaceae bacterium]|nr:hypothetical protein [Chitinophagaceae bacterium]
MKISFYLFTLLSLGFSCANNTDNEKSQNSGQSMGDPAIVWERTFFGEQNDRPHEIKIGSNNRIYILGQRFKINDSTGESSADVMVCLDMNGEKLWERALGNYQASRMMSFDINDRSELVIVGYYYENKEAVIKARSYGWIIKLNADGKLMQEKKYGGSFTRIKRSGDDFIITGSLAPIKGLVTSTCLKVFKIDTYLFVKWATSLADGDDCRWGMDGYNLCVNDKGEIAVVGSGNPPATKDELGYDAVIAKFSNDGKKLWYKYYAVANGYDFFRSVTWKDGIYYTCGITGNTVGAELDVVLCGFDENGVLKVNGKYGGSQTEYGNSIKAWNGQLIITGYSQSSDGDLKNNIGYSDYCIFKTDMRGKLLNVTSFGTERLDQMQDFVVHNDMMYIAAAEDKGLQTAWKVFCMKMKR